MPDKYETCVVCAGTTKVMETRAGQFNLPSCAYCGQYYHVMCGSHVFCFSDARGWESVCMRCINEPCG